MEITVIEDNTERPQRVGIYGWVEQGFAILDVKGIHCQKCHKYVRVTDLAIPNPTPLCKNCWKKEICKHENLDEIDLDEVVRYKCLDCGFSWKEELPQ